MIFSEWSYLIAHFCSHMENDLDSNCSNCTSYPSVERRATATAVPTLSLFVDPEAIDGPNDGSIVVSQ